MTIGEDDPPDPFMMPPPKDVIFEKFAYLEKRIDRIRNVAACGVAFGVAALIMHSAIEAYDASFQTATWIGGIAFVVALLGSLRILDLR